MDARGQKVRLAPVLPVLLAGILVAGPVAGQSIDLRVPDLRPFGPRVPAAEVPAVRVRGANHPGFGRVVVNADPGQRPRLAREGDRVIFTLPGSGQIGTLESLPRNVRALRGGLGQVELSLAPGARLRSVRQAGQLVIDVLDPPAEPAQRAEAQALPLPPPAPPPLRPVPATPTETVAKAPATAITPPVAGPSSVPTAPSPVAAVETAPREAPPTPTPVPAPAAPSVAEAPAPSSPPLSPPPSPQAAAAAPPPRPEPATAIVPGFLAPFEAGVGAAAFRRGKTGHVVFDQRRPLDLAPLRGHPVLGAARVQLLAAGTLLSIPLPPEMELALTRTPAGWQIDVRPGIAAAQPIRVVPAETRLLLAAAEVGSVLTMADPESGAILLVGTQRRHGQAMPATRRWATFVTGHSWLGVVVEPLSDVLSMRPSAEGFLLAGGPDGLPMGDDPGMANPMAQARALSRSFGFANETAATLQGLQRVQMIDAATAPALRRGPKRRALAQTLISLGLAAEAHAVLGVAATDDPREAEAPETIGLIAVAALLAGRLDEAGGLDDPRLDESDELKFWRAARTALRGENGTTAADLAGTVSLLNAYPAAMQTRLLPAVVESLLLGERVMAARALLQRWPELPSLAYARALLQEADGQADKALGALDALVAGPDRLLRAKAGLRATELRLARGELTPSAAAAALERLLFAWRGDARDFALRLRAAELHVRSGAWRPALAMLRDTEQLFPEQKERLQEQMRQSVAQLLEAPAMARMASLDLVALVDENAELMPDGEAGLDLAARLSERLMALDLPRRAEPLLRKLVGATPGGPVRARFGARLAALRLQEADAAGALAALGESVVEKLPAALVEERSLIAARARARQGDAKGAVAALADLDSEVALRARVDILEAARDWPRAAQAMQALARRILPAEGKLDDSQQRSLLRLATLAAQAGDAELLGRLRGQDLPRFSPGPVADLFRLFTAEGVQGVADLPRAGQELALARALAADPGQR